MDELARNETQEGDDEFLLGDGVDVVESLGFITVSDSS